MPKHKDLNSRSSVEFCKQLLKQPPGPWPAHWQGLRNVKRAAQELLREAIDEPAACPFDWSQHDESDVARAVWRDQSRGIVICGGGWRFLPSLYVTIRMIRASGCSLPVQVWYLGDKGEHDQRFAALLEPWGVQWVDGSAEARKPGRERRVLGGWELKPFAVAYSPFAEVIYLDADAYPAGRDLELFIESPQAREAGAVFFPDQNPLEPGQFRTFGVEPRDEPSFESGFFYVDKRRHWRALYATIVLNDLSDFTYQHVYGDKDTFHLAWRAAGHEYAMTTERPGWDTIAFVHYDFDGSPLVIHRTRDKFRFSGGLVDGKPIGAHNWWMTPQWSFSQLQPTHGGKISRSCGENLFVDSLPVEHESHEYLAELEDLMRPDGKNGATANVRHLRNEAELARAEIRQRPARLLATHHRSGSQFARLLVSAAVRRAGRSIRSLSFGGGSEPAGINRGDCSEAGFLAAFDFAHVVANSNASVESLEILNERGDNWRAVHVWRDPRDVVVSAYHAYRGFHDASAVGATMLERIREADPDEAMRLTIDSLAWFFKSLRTWPADDRVLEISFGELTRSPAASLSRICSHFDLDIGPTRVLDVCREISFERLSSGRKPGQENRDHHFRKGVVGDWRSHFSQATLDHFSAAAGDLLARWRE